MASTSGGGISPFENSTHVADTAQRQQQLQDKLIEERNKHLMEPLLRMECVEPGTLS